MENDKKTTTFFSGMPPKTAFTFGFVCAVAVMSILGLLIVVPMKLKGSVKGAATTETAAATDTTQPTAQPAVDINDVKTDGSPFIGDADAPVVMAYWTDYQCPFCQRFDQQTLSTLISNYVDKGKLKVVVKSFAFLGPDSTTAALAERAVWDVAPKQYLEWHRAMYSKQDEENGGWGNKDDIIALTKTIKGIDADKVAKLMNEKAEEYQKQIDADKAEGEGFGINGTPGFIVGKQLISGAVPLAQFTSAIEKVLAAK